MVFVFSAVTIILAFAAVIILNISVTYQPPLAAYAACKKAANISCGEVSVQQDSPNITPVKTQHPQKRSLVSKLSTLTDISFVMARAAHTIKNARSIGDRTLMSARADRQRRVNSIPLGPSSTGSQNCGHDPARVCAVSNDDVSCLATTAQGQTECTSDSLHQCTVPTQSPDLCFGVAVQRDPTRNITITGAVDGAAAERRPGLSCCHGACGDYLLDAASCSVDPVKMKFVERCVCGWSDQLLIDLDQKIKSGEKPSYGKCPHVKQKQASRTFAHAAFSSSAAANTSHSVIGVTMCKWRVEQKQRGPDDNKDDASRYADSADPNKKCEAADTCQDWAECQAYNMCYPEDISEAINDGYATVSLIVLAGSLVIFIGTIPICISGLAKARGVDDIAHTCGAIGCFSSILLAGCGGTIMMFVPFIVGGFLTSSCNHMQLSAARFKGDCAVGGLEDCGEVLTLDVMQLCAIGEGMFSASTCQIAAQISSLCAVVVTMVTWWQRKQRRRSTEQVEDAKDIVEVRAEVVV
jgi:hypothetical protein